MKESPSKYTFNLIVSKETLLNKKVARHIRNNECSKKSHMISISEKSFDFIFF